MVEAQTMGHNKNMRNKLGTQWEHDENKLGTRKMKKNLYLPCPNPKGKKLGQVHAEVRTSH